MSCRHGRSEFEDCVLCNRPALSSAPRHATPELWVSAPHRCAKDDEVAELRECLRLAWASACAAEQVLISAAALARIRKALEEA